MRRRDFITALGGTAIFWPLATRAQQYAKPFRIGFFPLGSPANQYDQSLVDAFRRGLRQIGLVENRDIALEITWIGGDDPERLIAKVIQSGVNLLVPCGSSASAAAKHLTASIPIVFISVGNPVGMALVRNLPNPGFNVTGFSDGLGEISGKLIELSTELLKPGFRATDSVDYLWYSDWPDGKRGDNSYGNAPYTASAVGQSLPKWAFSAMSTFPPIATKLRTSRDVSNVPTGDSCAPNDRSIQSPRRHGRAMLARYRTQTPSHF
jgi:hypothetical protein